MVRALFIVVEVRRDDIDFNSSHDNLQVGVETNS